MNLGRALLLRVGLLLVVAWFVVPYVSIVRTVEERGNATATTGCTTQKQPVVVRVPLSRWPHVGEHIRDAQAGRSWDGSRMPRVLTINRVGADKRRAAAMRLSGLAGREDMDRDEQPPAFARSTNAASVRYVPDEENQSQGAVMGNTLRKFCDGQRFELRVTR